MCVLGTAVAAFCAPNVLIELRLSLSVGAPETSTLLDWDLGFTSEAASQGPSTVGLLHSICAQSGQREEDFHGICDEGGATSGGRGRTSERFDVCCLLHVSNIHRLAGIQIIYRYPVSAEQVISKLPIAAETDRVEVSNFVVTPCR